MSESEETIWDPISSLAVGHVIRPSDLVLDSSRSFFRKTKKYWPERLLQRPSTSQNHICENHFPSNFPHKQSEKFLNLGTLAWRTGLCMPFRGISVRVGHTFWSMRAWYPKCRCSETDVHLALGRLPKLPWFKNEIHRIVSKIWRWEISLLHLTREVCLPISKYAGLTVVWSGPVLLW